MVIASLNFCNRFTKGFAMDCEMTVLSECEQNSLSVKQQQHGLEWNWRYFINWLRFISLYPLTNNPSKVANGIALIIRFGLWVVNLVAHILQLFLFYYYGYDTPLATEYWNAVIDYWNWTAHSLAVHYIIIFVALRKNHWMRLNKLLVKIDNAMQGYDAKTSLRLKNKSILALIYITLTVST